MAPNNSLAIHGNEKTMNLNHLILTNIQSSPYFKVNLYELKTYHEVIDEIYYKVTHLEPWEKGSRKTAGQTGMCGGVRGVGAGGIVSSAFCLLYKLCTLKLTRKQVIGLMEHSDSPYIRALGFMYIRYTQAPADYWEWYMPYLEDEEELDVKAGGGHTMAIGELARQWLTKIEWYTTLFPRIPVPIQKMLEGKLREYDANKAYQPPPPPESESHDPSGHIPDGQLNFGEAERLSNLRGPEDETASRSSPFQEQPRVTERNSHERTRPVERDHHRQQQRDRDRERRDDSNRDHDRRDDSHKQRDRRDDGHKQHDRRENSHKDHRRRSRSRSRDKHRRRSRSHDRHKHNRQKDSDHKHREHKHRDRHRSRSRDGSRSRDHHSNSKHLSKSSDKHSRHPRSRSREKSGNHSSSNHGGRESSFERDLRREKARQKRDKHSHRNGDK